MPTTVDQTAVLGWYRANRRELPWRETRDPYAIWVSEIMLQQTQVATVIPYFVRWMERFPTVDILARADEQEVLSAWQGLGYYRRCRMLLDGARWVVERGIPANSASWLKTPGVGRYTAAAIASIGHGEVVALVDGNVERVFARFTGFEGTGSALTRSAWIWAADQLDRQSPGDWNQAMMELGATVCRPRNPDCEACPLSTDCFARSEGRQRDLPVPKKRPSTVVLCREAYICLRDGKLGLQRIPAGEWWAGMWRFPGSCPAPEVGWRPIGVIKHVVTQHKITMQVYLGMAERPFDLEWFSPEELTQLPMPAAQRRALELATRPSTS